jgi:glutamyl/glutaminyl-tRNA synthetase
MVLGPDHTKLSKRHGAVSVDEFRAKGYLPEALLNYLALLSWSPGHDQELMPLDEMASRFALENVGHAPSVFDEEKLAWVNRHYLKEADAARLASLAVPYLSRAGYVVATPDADSMKYLAGLAPIFQTSVDRLEQVPERLRQIFEYSPSTVLNDAAARAEVEAGAGRSVIDALADELADAPRLVDRQTFRGVADRVKQKSGQKGRGLFHPIRLALTGASDGPELDLLVPAIDRGADAALPAIGPITGARERARQFADTLK